MPNFNSTSDSFSPGIHMGNIGNHPVNQNPEWKLISCALIILGVSCLMFVGIKNGWDLDFLKGKVFQSPYLYGSSLAGILITGTTIGVITIRTMKKNNNQLNLPFPLSSPNPDSSPPSHIAPPSGLSEHLPTPPIITPPPLASPSHPASPQENHANQAVLLTPEVLKLLSDRMKKKQYAQNKPLMFKIDGEEYFAWQNFQAINIQARKSWNEGSKTYKIGIKVNDESAIESVYVDGTPAGNIPEERIKWVLAAFEVCKAEMDAEAAALEIEQQFTIADLSVFRAALQAAGSRPIVVKVEDHSYAVWYKADSKAINIQDVQNYNERTQKNKLGIIIDQDGKITSLWLNGEKKEGVKKVPEEYLPRMKACFKRALEASSQYKITAFHEPYEALINVSAVRRGLKEIPEFHLEQISKMIIKGIIAENDPKIKVTFLSEKLEPGIAIDAGGLSRDFFDDLFEGLTKGQTLQFNQIESSSLLIPSTQEKYKEESPLPVLNPQEQAVYFQMGQLMMYCYHSQKLPGHWDTTNSIGRFFDDALFSAALCLTAHEVETPFESLAADTHLKMCRALAKSHGETIYDRRIELLSKQALTDEEWMEAAQIAIWADCLPEEFSNEDSEPEKGKMLANKEKVKSALADSLFGNSGSVGQFGSQLAPIHAIAKGMMSLCNPGPHASSPQHKWPAFNQLNYKDFSTKVQGSIDRQEIVGHIEVSASISDPAEKVELEKKMGWLKEWLQEEASDEEVRKFLKFVTGVCSLPQGKQITVTRQQIGSELLPVPKAHTCSLEIELSPMPAGDPHGYNDHSKENFITSLKELVLSDPGAYSSM